jgi:hypothetical protein
MKILIPDAQMRRLYQQTDLFVMPSLVAATMHEILANPALQAKMSEKGHIQFRKFHPHVVREQVSISYAEFEGTVKPARGKENALW